MFLKNLLAATGEQIELPIEIEEIADHLVRAGCQDEIIFYPDDKMDFRELKGVHYRFRRRPKLYGDYQDVTMITFCAKMPIDWQRIICCKELIHVCDSEVERTDTEDEVNGLLDKLLGPLTSDNFGAADIMASKDKLAIYQALAILFPLPARDRALEEIAAGRKSIEQIATWSQLPISLVGLVLDKEWPALREAVLNI